MNSSFAFDIGGTTFESNHVALFELQFRGILDRDDPLLLRNITGEHVEEGGFARAGSPRNNNVEPRLNRASEQGQHGLGERLICQQVIFSNGDVPETTNRHVRAINGQRRDDHVHTGAIGQAGIHHRRRFIDTTADRRNNLVNDVHQVRIILEHDLGLFELAPSLDVNLLGSINEDVSDCGILQQRLQRTQTKDLVQNLKR